MYIFITKLSRQALESFFYLLLYTIMVLTHSADKSLEELWRLWAARSFHTWNLTPRDLVPVLSWCQWEMFDMNTLKDSAYYPTKMIVQWHTCNIDLASKTTYASTSIVQKPPQFPWNDKKFVNQKLIEAFEESNTLVWFWLRINESLQVWEFTTFSQKITWNKEFVRNILNTITQQCTDELLSFMWKRYIHADGQTYILQGITWDTLHYEHNWNIVSLHKNDLVESSVNFFTHRSLLTQKNTNIPDIIAACSWPIFCNEMNTLLIALIDAKKHNTNQVYHLWWQAMCAYTKWWSFSENYKKLLHILDENNNLDDSLQYQWITLHIVPAFHHRFLGYDTTLTELLDCLTETDKKLKSLSTSLWTLFKGWKDITDHEIQNLTKERNQYNTMMKKTISTIQNHPALVTMPLQTKKTWTLNTLYQSQLDLLLAQQQWFNPKEHRSSFTKIPIADVWKRANKIAK